MPVTGHGLVVRYQGLLQNHNIRHDLIPREFGNWRAYIIWCKCSAVLSWSCPHKFVERTAPLRPRMTRQAA